VARMAAATQAFLVGFLHPAAIKRPKPSKVASGDHHFFHIVRINSDCGENRFLPSAFPIPAPVEWSSRELVAEFRALLG